MDSWFTKTVPYTPELMRLWAEVIKKILVEIIIFTRGNVKEEFFLNIALFQNNHAALNKIICEKGVKDHFQI